MNDSLSGHRVACPDEGPLPALMNDIWAAMARDGSSFSRNACLGSGLLWGMALALAGPEYAVALMSELSDVADMSATNNKLRRWIEAHPISIEQAAQS